MTSWLNLLPRVSPLPVRSLGREEYTPWERGWSWLCQIARRQRMFSERARRAPPNTLCTTRDLRETPQGFSVSSHRSSSYIIQHCWTMLHSVKRGGQTDATCLMQYLDARSGTKIYPEFFENKPAPYWFDNKWRETDQPPGRTRINSLFLVLQFYLLFCRFPFYLKRAQSLRDSKLCSFAIL